MIKIDFKDKKIVDELYDTLRNLIVLNIGEANCTYTKYQHRLCEESIYPGISKKFYNENGNFEFENVNGKTIFVEISRTHPHKHNGWGGLNDYPCLNAQIYTIESGHKKLLWELDVESGTLRWEAKVTSLELPGDILIAKITKSEEKIKDKSSEDICAKESTEILDKTNLFDELANVAERYRELKEEKKNIISQREQEIDAARVQITEKYHKIIDDYDNIAETILSDLNCYDELVSKYSTFNLDKISIVIAEIVTLIEGKKFQSKSIIDRYQKIVHGPIDSWDETIERKMRIVVDSLKSQNYYDRSNSYSSDRYISEVDQLVDGGNAVILSANDSKNTTFFSSENGNVTCLVNFGKFNYMKDFVIELIQYRFQRKKDVVTNEDLIFCMQNFISKFESQISANYLANINARVLKTLS